MLAAWTFLLLKGNTMFKKIFIVIMILALPLTACSVLQSAQAMVSGSNSYSQNQGQNQGQNPFGGITANTPVDSKLAIGMLKLEGTDLAVTPDQAKNLLPLWQALKTLSSSATTAPEEVTAVFQQIQDTLTPEQMKAIKEMALSQDDMQALMKSLGMQTGAGFGNGGTVSPEQQATRTARRTQNPSGGGFGGPGGGFGGPGPGGDFGGPGGNSGAGNQGSTKTRPTQSPQNIIRRSMGMNLLFMDPLIKILETRAAGS
jgi:hypothetical protein